MNAKEKKQESKHCLQKGDMLVEKNQESNGWKLGVNNESLLYKFANGRRAINDFLYVDWWFIDRKPRLTRKVIA